jgi:predicted ATP-dependent endonuclease of OLD family
MKIVSLKSENIKRLHAVEITPEGTLVTIGGKNGAGKSSVLDSIAYALGGKDLVPSEPIRMGETEAKIVVDLGEFIVTRKFKREALPEINGTITYGPTNSTLVVTNKDGAKYPTPQSILDKLLGKLTFDPLAFAHTSAKEQNAILRKLVNLDTTEIDEKRKMAFGLRTDLKRQAAALVSRISAAPKYPDAPKELIPLQEMKDILTEAEQLRSVANVKLAKAKEESNRLENDLEEQKAIEREIHEYELRINTRKKDLADYVSKISKEQDLVETARNEAQIACDAIPNTQVIQQKLQDIETTNHKVNANKKYNELHEEHDKLAEAITTQTTTIEEVDKTKQELLETVKFPIPGLGLSEEGVTYNGVPFEQASTSEQLRISVAIGIALNPTLKVLLVRNGNALDKDSMLNVAEQAHNADAQVWMEYVTDEAGKVAVMIEDGTVV